MRFSYACDGMDGLVLIDECHWQKETLAAAAGGAETVFPADTNRSCI